MPKKIYNTFMLSNILNGKKYISETFIERYEKHHKELKELKSIYLKIGKDSYNKMFRDKNVENNYIAYIKNNIKVEKDKLNPFFKKIEKDLETFKLNGECKEDEIDNILEKIKNKDFLLKLNTVDNSIIPYQLHKNELIKILENQKQYYPTIEKNVNNILKLFEFKIPYYVGPLIKNKNDSKWGWLIRNKGYENEKITPWNFDTVVNIDDTAEEFIIRMTKKCTYFPTENVLPINLLLYSEYNVLSELNNIKINNKRLSRDLKEKIINEVFKKCKNVTKKRVLEILQRDFNATEITGLSDETKFNSNLSSYIDMTKIIGKLEENYKMCENIIYWNTIFEDKDILQRKIEKEYQNLSEEQIKRILRINYTGWGRLSKKLLNGIKSHDNETIIEILRNTNKNLMQIINDKNYGFKEIIEEASKIEKDKITYDDIDELFTSPANKKAIWQSLRVVKELISYMKHEPEHIYIEFAKKDGGERTIPTVDKIKKLYKNIEKETLDITEASKILNKLDSKHLTIKQVLYFLQNSKCLYSNTKLEFNELETYEVDHIIPRSYIKDDSMDNLALVKKIENQRKGDGIVLDKEVQDKCRVLWDNLYKAKLISQVKYSRLLRTISFYNDGKYNNEESFVNRQLVETRQIIKYTTNFLMN